MIEAKIVADSTHAYGGPRITTFLLTYPRFLHAEFMTHRVFSRNAQSSRAVPVLKRIQAVIDNPAIPLVFTKNKPGMQGGDALDDQDAARDAWLRGRDSAVVAARELAAMEVHKQYANRVIEPYDHISVVCTSTSYDNFFALRIHPYALPEIQALAMVMYAALNESTPTVRYVCDWHLPFVSEGERVGADINTLIRQSVARCARVSYLNHDGTKTTVEQDLQLYERLVGSHPIHASPAEHQATPTQPNRMSGNFQGWLQHRKTLCSENIADYEQFKRGSHETH